MKRRISRLIGALAVGLLCTAPLAPAGAQTPDELAVKGATLAQADPLAAKLRASDPSPESRRGFDIGMAVADGQTLPGPGKDKFRDMLPVEERSGFNTAVAFSVERTRLATKGTKLTEGFVDLVSLGTAIARQDPIVAVARALLDSDVVYRLGFDIATAIFGDPALGAQGNTLTGPGSLRVRDMMSEAGQRGFNDGVKLHLSRNYKRP